MIERSLVLIKPDGVKRALVGTIINRFENAGLKIVGMKMVHADRNFAETHYKAHSKKSFFGELVEFITEGPVVAMVLEGVHAIDNVRKLVGDTSPAKAMPGTIRGDLAHISMEYASKMGSGGKNLIHASSNQKDAESEIKLWFKKKELYSYETAHEEHTF